MVKLWGQRKKEEIRDLKDENGKADSVNFNRFKKTRAGKYLVGYVRTWRGKKMKREVEEFEV